MSEFEEGKPDASEEERGQPQPADTPLSPPPALREDQLHNAVAFLSHPKVCSSSVASKREFLQRKGLTEAEIDEAFRRVPQQSAAPPAVPAAAAPAAAPAAVSSTLQHLQPQQQLSYLQPQQGQMVYAQQPQGMQQQQQQPGYGPGALVVAGPPQQQGVRWTQAVLGAGFVAASAYAAKALLWPYMGSAYYSWRGQVRPPPRRPLANGDGEGERSAQATQAMADAIAAQTAELRGSIDAIKQLVTTLEASQKAAADAAASGAASGSAAAGGAADGLTVADLRHELRSFAETLQELASPKPGPAAADPAAAASPAKLESELGEIKTLLAELLRSPRSSGGHSPARPLPGITSTDGGSAATPSSATSALPPRYSTAMPASEAALPAAIGIGTPLPAASQQQEVQAADEQTPEHSQQAAPAPALAAGGAASPAASEPPKPPPHPASYMEVLEMLEKGQTPPGIRTDINDKPPNPNAAPPAARMKPRPKPWERGATSSLTGSLGGAGGSSSSLGSLGGGSSPWAAGPAAVAGSAAAAAGPAVGAVPSEPAGSPSVAVQAASPAASPAAEPPLQQMLSPVDPPLQQQALSPVRAPSPAEEAAAAVVAAAEAAGGAAGQAAQQGSEQGSAAVAGSSFQSPRRAASIYDAVAPAPDSPHIIAGRLSPVRPDKLARSASGNSVGGAGAQPAAAGVTASGGGSSHFAALLAAAQERASAGGAFVWSSLDGPLVPAPLEGSGIGRPISRNWRPPPIPAPTLSGSTGGSIAAPAAGSTAGSNAGVPSGSSTAPLPAAGGGLANGGTKAASVASLGEDFASA
ncbi:hypothetical protein ABPG75_010965 [Micractinium tetrahymenae]